MKILVTGAAGRLGTAVCAELLGAGNEVFGVDLVPNRENLASMQFFDLRDPISCMRMLEGMDALVHLGNHTNHARGSFQRIYTENCAMNANVFHAAEMHGVRRVIFASSIQVIAGNRRGDQKETPSCLPYLPLDSNLPAHPANSYSLSKFAGEEIVRYLVEFGGVETGISIRFPLLLREFWRLTKRQGRIVPKRDQELGYLDEGFSILAVPDAAQLVRCCIEAPIKGYRCYLPASPTNIFYQTPVGEIADHYFPGVPRKPSFTELKLMCDTRIITEEVGWHPMPIDVSEPR